MATKNKAVEEVEKLLQDIGARIEELIVKGKEASGEAKKEIDNKVGELKKKKRNLEKDFLNKKIDLDQKYKSKKKEMTPKLEKSKVHFKEAFNQLMQGLKALLGK